MKIKKGYKWKSIEGPCKGNEFVITEVEQDEVIYRNNETGSSFTSPRKHFEKYIERVGKHWNETKKSYKRNKEKLKE